MAHRPSYHAPEAGRAVLATSDHRHGLSKLNSVLDEVDVILGEL
jgi:hypothetical protein